MDIKLLLKNKNKVLIFLLLFFSNIGLKEVFRLVEDSKQDITYYLFCSILSFSFIIFSSYLIKEYAKLYMLVITLFLILFLSSFIAEDPSYGIEKSFLGILLPLFLFSIFVKIKWTKELIIDSFILSIFIISIIAIPYKLAYGFLNRATSFGLLGSIPFGWVNGFAFILIGIKDKKKIGDYLLMLFFVLMIMWTGSKGPLVALVVIVGLNFNRILGKKVSTKVITFMLLGMVAMILIQFADDIRSIRGVLDFFSDPEGYATGVGKGSIGSRSNYILIAWDSFTQNPLLGSGFGTFGEVNNTLHKYPHNIYMELLAEGGAICFFFFLLILLNNSFEGIGIGVVFMLICLSFSGDISYFRYAFYPLLVSTYIYRLKFKN